MYFFMPSKSLAIKSSWISQSGGKWKKLNCSHFILLILNTFFQIITIDELNNEIFVKNRKWMKQWITKQWITMNNNSYGIKG